MPFSSRPTRACGLKPSNVRNAFADDRVTPHTGVWIETSKSIIIKSMIESRPTRACGLKLNILAVVCMMLRHAPHGRVD